MLLKFVLVVNLTLPLRPIYLKPVERNHVGLFYKIVHFINVVLFLCINTKCLCSFEVTVVQI